MNNLLLYIVIFIISSSEIIINVSSNNVHEICFSIILFLFFRIHYNNRDNQLFIIPFLFYLVNDIYFNEKFGIKSFAIIVAIIYIKYNFNLYHTINQAFDMKDCLNFITIFVIVKDLISLLLNIPIAIEFSLLNILYFMIFAYFYNKIWIKIN